MNKARFFMGLVTAVLALCHSSAALGGGYNLVPRGARCLGRAGACSATASDLSAAWANPARLATIRGVQVLADVGVTFWQLGFERAADPQIAPDGFGRVANMAPPVASPSLFLGWDFGLDWLQVTLGFYAPYGGDLGFQSLGPQRYTLIYLDMFDANYQIAVAARPFSWLAVGAAFQIRDVRMTQALKLTAYTGFDLFGPSEDPSDDIFAELEVASHFNPSGLLGIWIGPADWVDLSLTVQLPSSIHAPGTVQVDLPPDNPLLRNAWVDGDQVTAHLESATVIRAGAALRLPHRIEVEVDTWAEVWEPHEDIGVEIHDVFLRNTEGGMDLEMQDITVPQDWHASFGAAFAIDWETLEERLHLTVGAYYDSGGIPDQTVSVAWFDSHKLGLAAGLSVQFWRLAIDLAYCHVFFLSRQVDNSELRQINPIEPAEPDLANIVGNGSYDSSMDVIAVAARAAF